MRWTCFITVEFRLFRFLFKTMFNTFVIYLIYYHSFVAPLTMKLFYFLSIYIRRKLFTFRRVLFAHEINVFRIHDDYVCVPPIKQQDGGTVPFLNFTTIAQCCEILLLTKSGDRCSHWYTVRHYHLSFSEKSDEFFFNLEDRTRHVVNLFYFNFFSLCWVEEWRKSTIE